MGLCGPGEGMRGGGIRSGVRGVLDPRYEGVLDPRYEGYEGY